MDEESKRISVLRDKLQVGILAGIEKVK